MELLQFKLNLNAAKRNRFDTAVEIARHPNLSQNPLLPQCEAFILGEGEGFFPFFPEKTKPKWNVSEEFCDACVSHFISSHIKFGGGGNVVPLFVEVCQQKTRFFEPNLWFKLVMFKSQKLSTQSRPF